MSFDRIAPFYRTLENFAAGGLMQRCRTEFLTQIPVPKRILLAGEGHGRFLESCLRQFPEAEIVVVDASREMLAIASKRVTSPRVAFVHADLLKPLVVGVFDLIVTNFFLDCFPPDQLPRVVKNLAQAATPEAVWLLGDFQVADGRLKAVRSKVILWLLYTFFRMTCGLGARFLTPPGPLIEVEGFRLVRRATHDWGLMKSEWWQRG